MNMSEAREDVRIICLGDLHYGCPQTVSLHEELQEIFIPYIEKAVMEEEKKLDAVVQLGDFWHRHLSLNSEEASMGLVMGTGLAAWLDSYDVPFYILRGTISHDLSQLNAFDQSTEDVPLFHVVKTAAEMTLPHRPDFRILFMPEEYPRDYEAFYSPWIDREGDDRPDLILGHGEIDWASTWSRASAGESHYGGTPTHQAPRLLKGTKGIVVFGHIHSRFERRGIYYPGSFTRWIHGEEPEKGFFDITLRSIPEDGRGREWKEEVRFIENTKAKTYITLPALEICAEGDPVEAIVRKVSERAQTADYLRVDFRDYEISPEEAVILRSSFLRNAEIDIRLSAAASLDVLKEEVDEEEVEDRYAYLVDDSTAAEERLARYVNEQGGVRVTVDQVRELTAPPTT